LSEYAKLNKPAEILGIIVRQSISNTIVSYVGISLGFVLTILLYPHILAPEEYGLTRVLISASYMCSQFAHLGFQHLVIRYYPFFKKADPGRHGLLFWAFTIPFAGFLIFIAIYLLAGDLIIAYYMDQSPLFVEYFLWVIPLTLFILYFEVLNSYLRSLRDSVTGSLVNEVLQRILVIALLAVYFYNLISFGWFIALFVMSYMFQPILVAISIHRKNEFQIFPNFKIIRRKLVYGMARFSLYSLLGGLTTIIVWNVDVIMLGSMAGLGQTAIYAIAFYIASVVNIPQRSVEKIAGPLLSDFIKNKNWHEVGSVYSKTSLNQLLAGLLIFGLIWLHLDELFLLLPDIYAAGKWVVFIIAIGKLFEAITGPNTLILLNSQHYRVSFFANIFLVFVTISANYLLIPLYGINGAAFASALALILFNLVKLIYIYYWMNLQPLSFPMISIVAFGSISIYICHTMIDFSSIWLNMPVKTIVFLVMFLAPLLYLNVSPDLNNLLRTIQKQMFS
jgi:O-antigen/teichoic acid export membrane protein